MPRDPLGRDAHARDARIITGSFVDFGNGSSLDPLTGPAGYTFALRGFRFYYRNGDHHRNAVGILDEASGVRTYFSDENADDPYAVYVDYAWLPSSMVETTSVLSGNDDGGGVSRSVTTRPARSSPAPMDSTSSDHHLQEIRRGDRAGVRMNEERTCPVGGMERVRSPGYLSAPFCMGGCMAIENGNVEDGFRG